MFKNLKGNPMLHNYLIFFFVFHFLKIWEKKTFSFDLLKILRIKRPIRLQVFQIWDVKVFYEVSYLLTKNMV